MSSALDLESGTWHLTVHFLKWCLTVQCWLCTAWEWESGAQQWRYAALVLVERRPGPAPGGGPRSISTRAVFPGRLRGYSRGHEEGTALQWTFRVLDKSNFNYV